MKKLLVLLTLGYLVSSHMIESRGGRVLLAGAVISNANNRYDSDYAHRTKAIERQIKEEKHEIKRLEKELDKILRKKITAEEKQLRQNEYNERITAHKNKVNELQNELIRY